MLPSREKKIGAAIDMGTNTFHILIAEAKNGRLIEVVRKRVWVNLAEAGINSISEAALVRAWDALVEFRLMLDEFPDIKTVTVATEAFRSADNGIEFLEKVRDELKLNAKIIPGDREAELIYKGISLISPGGNDASLIMDIGGGSTEFILYDNHKGILWSQSYRAGVTYLYNLFAHSDPLSIEDEISLFKYFDKTFPDLLSICSKFKIKNLIGASGSFEVLEFLSGQKPDYSTINDIEIDQFNNQFSLLRNSNKEERLNIHGIPLNRARMIVVAIILMKYVISKVEPNKISVSPYAMKEGVIREILNI